VQSEILYSPDLQFYFFDIAVENKLTHEKVYLDYWEASRVWSDVGVLWAQPLLIGSFTEVLDCSVDFPTTLPAMMGLPQLADNVAEGVVIKPLIEVSLSSSGGGGKGGRQRRAIVKRKAERFLEKVATYNAGLSQSYKGGVKDSQDTTVFNCLLSLLNANRLAAVRSKVGPKVSASTLTPLLLQDIMSSAEEDETVWVAWNHLTDAQRDVVNQRLSHRVKEFVLAAVKR
jgi:Rnl2 family RNA ligase